MIKLSKQYDEIVFVTGTNGKTTTSNLIGHTLKEAGINFINNFEGANMLDGIISTFAIQSKNDTKLAVIEIDEGSIKKVMQYITPTKFVINNFFRDQIDRFGEIDTLIATIGEQLEGKNIQLILNSDDLLLQDFLNMAIIIFILVLIKMPIVLQIMEFLSQNSALVVELN